MDLVQENPHAWFQAYLPGDRPQARNAELGLVSRVVVELIYATVEMIFDEPQDVKVVARTVAGMVASHMARIGRVEMWRGDGRSEHRC